MTRDPIRDISTFDMTRISSVREYFILNIHLSTLLYFGQIYGTQNTEMRFVNFIHKTTIT